MTEDGQLIELDDILAYFEIDKKFIDEAESIKELGQTSVRYQDGLIDECT